MKAVENGGTAIGIRCKDGVVLALEKLVSSKLLKKDANKRIATIDRHMGVVSIIGYMYCIITVTKLLTTSSPSRSTLDFYPMAATSSPERVMRLPAGAVPTKHRSPFPHSPTAWAPTYKPTPSTLP